MVNVFASVLIAFFICVISGPLLIPVLRKLKFGQSILEIGPQWHAKKSGTPTMGGIIFILAAIITTLLLVKDVKVLIILATSVAFGIIGFIDDYIKVVLKRNLGLTASQKFLAQTVAAVGFTIFLYHSGYINNEIYVPFLSGLISLEWWIFIPFTVFVILATVNSVNLTDGLDGLAAGITVAVSVFFTVVAFILKDYNTAAFSAAITGGCMGFLLFNAHPAKVFMGDTGSLFLGGAICSVAIALKMPLFLIIVGGIYLIETLSVIMQVTSFKFTGKRIFKMSPIHHHFEMIGWKETKVVTVFVTATIILCIIGFLGINNVVAFIQ
ncbi:phospho-N-acetylmuramoyl-pentapeptide-transferase [Petroclostridium sp. X23]|uniref:phospho-N-acetylmuramoyl-pentapeptide- transferase n=1 Tax=Petroclostridium sp. X23 TaxID=3045146 RepID=UPI0024AC8563|nr:phospho-N-acetylmuramoyl-pentapeptide-transferase [Petroclostridium sp. X23]WHH58890.1 phospho-N-acetylmuramoyl-pentapeptide-transferase [Petroclostridium sp. X23]